MNNEKLVRHLSVDDSPDVLKFRSKITIISLSHEKIKINAKKFSYLKLNCEQISQQVLNANYNLLLNGYFLY